MAATLQRRNEIANHDLLAMSDSDIISDYAAMQWADVLETAQYVYHMPKVKPKGAPLSRDMKLKFMAASDNVIERYAAMIVRRWDEQDKEKEE